MDDIPSMLRGILLNQTQIMQRLDKIDNGQEEIRKNYDKLATIVNTLAPQPLESAGERVVNIPELLEVILCYLGAIQEWKKGKLHFGVKWLHAARQVSRQFKAVIDESQNLQRTLGCLLEPSRPHGVRWYDRNWLLNDSFRRIALGLTAERQIVPITWEDYGRVPLITISDIWDHEGCMEITMLRSDNTHYYEDDEERQFRFSDMAGLAMPGTWRNMYLASPPPARVIWFLREYEEMERPLEDYDEPVVIASGKVEGACTLGELLQRIDVVKGDGDPMKRERAEHARLCFERVLNITGTGVQS